MEMELPNYLNSGVIALNFSNSRSKSSLESGFTKGAIYIGNFCNNPFLLIGLFSKLPPQLGHTLCKTVSTQLVQNVHSKLQTHASADSRGKGLPQFWQAHFNSNRPFMVFD
jgi:hypothetical protein